MSPTWFERRDREKPRRRVQKRAEQIPDEGNADKAIRCPNAVPGYRGHEKRRETSLGTRAHR